MDIRQRMFPAPALKVQKAKKDDGSGAVKSGFLVQKSSINTDGANADSQSQRLQQCVLFATACIVYSLLPFFCQLARLEKKVNVSGPHASPAAVTFFAELGKSSVVAATLLWHTIFGSSCESDSSKDASAKKKAVKKQEEDKFSFGYLCLINAVPAVLYTITNNIHQIITHYMDGATAQALLQSRVMTTSLLWHWVFVVWRGDKSHSNSGGIAVHQWMALCSLTAGTGLVSYESGKAKDEGGLADNDKGSSAGEQLFVTPVGIALIVVFCLATACAGIWVEYAYKNLLVREGVAKRTTKDVLRFDLAMYSVGMFTNLSGYLLERVQSQVSTGGADAWKAAVLELLTLLAPSSLLKLVVQELPQGFTQVSLATVAVLVLMGFTLGKIMRHFSNIHKLLMQSCSMYLTHFLFWQFEFVQGFTPVFHVGAALIVSSVLLYNLNGIRSVLFASSGTAAAKKKH